MNKLIFLVITVTVMILFSFAEKTQAQNISSKIMDSSIEWSGTNGILKIYLTDTDGLSGLQIGLGTEADTMNVYLTQYSISGNLFGSGGGTVTDNVLSVPIGSFASGDYFARIRVLLSNSYYNEIEIASHN